MSRINQVPPNRSSAYATIGTQVPQYDLSKPPKGRRVNETEVRKFASNIKSFQNYSRKAMAEIVVGGQVAVK